MGQPWFRGAEDAAWPITWQGWLTQAAGLVWICLCTLLAVAGVLTGDEYPLLVIAGLIVFITTVIVKMRY
jgi:hypothetical protein